jgi:flagellar FliL protein
MADDEQKSAAAAANPPKRGGSMLPVLAVLILTPAISFAMTEYVLIPRIQEAVAQQAAKTQTQGGAPQTAAPKTAGHGGHGSKGEAEQSFEFSNIVVNLYGSMGTRYLKTSFSVVGSAPDLKAILTSRKDKLLDVTLTVLGSRTMADLEAAGAKNMLRNSLVASLNQALDGAVIEELYFSEFVVQ